MYVLLLEDDLASREYLAQALGVIGHQVLACGDVAEARVALSKQAFDALLSDANLPDGGAESLLEAMGDGHRPPLRIAMSAALDNARRTSLTEAGFQRIVLKPLGIDVLRGLLGGTTSRIEADFTANAGSDTGLIWDEAQALRALGGNRQAWDTLRGMFLQELPKQRDAVIHAMREKDHATAQSHLHQLQSSARLLGAVALREAVDALKESLDDETRLARFLSACAAVLGQAESG